jgi:hypothetical protein
LRFSVTNGPMSSILVPVLVIGLLGDMPLSLVVVSLSHARHPAIIHTCIAALGLLGVGWAIAVRSIMRNVPHVVSREALRLGGGQFYAGAIPRTSIQRVVAIQEARHDWMRAQGLRHTDVTPAHGLDAPNLAVKLHEASIDSIALIHKGKAQIPRRWVLLYTDQPVLLASALSAMSKDAWTLQPA